MIRPSPRRLVLIPSISTERLQEAAPWIAYFEDAGFTVHIVANSKSVAEMDLGGRTIDTGSNPGFAPSLMLAMSRVDPWDWLILVNDDMQLARNHVADINRELDRLSELDEADQLVLFDPEPPRRIPSMVHIFGLLSLISEVGRRLPQAFSKTTKAAPNTYKSFSLVAISRSAWDRLSGLNTQLPFCYEDADFVSRYIRATGRAADEYPLSVHHNKSASTRKNIAIVLPVIAYSAREYLVTQGYSRKSATTVSIAALVIRVALIPLARSPWRSHLSGTFQSMAYLIRGSVPKLPEYTNL